MPHRADRITNGVPSTRLRSSSNAWAHHIARPVARLTIVLRSVPIPDQRRLEDFRDPAGDEAVEQLREAAAPLKGSRLDQVRLNAERFEPDADFVFVHDPQPVALLTFLEESGRRTGRWAWRCHIDLSQPMEQVGSFFALHVARYDAAVFTLP